jgi:hypothetical protein
VSSWCSSRKLGADDASVHFASLMLYSGSPESEEVTQSLSKASTTVQGFLLSTLVLEPVQSDTGKTTAFGNTHSTNGLGGQSSGCTVLGEDSTAGNNTGRDPSCGLMPMASRCAVIGLGLTSIGSSLDVG